MAKQQHITWSLTIALALTVMLGPFSTDTYLPAFPQMAEALGVDISKIALTISVYILTMSIGLLIGGPLSDNFGRRMVLVTGLFITLFASFAVGMSNSIGAVLFFRVLHAFGAGWVLVSVPAMIRDRVSGQEAAKLFSMIGLIMVIAPAIAPAVGSSILEIASWRWIFFFISLYALFLILIAWSIIFPHMPPRVGPRKVANLMDGYLAVIRERRSWPFILWQSASFSVIMVFVTQASYIYQDHFGLSPSRFSLFFAANIAAMLGFNLINRILLQSVRSIRILRYATICHFAGLFAMMLSVILEWGLIGFVPALMVSVGSLGAVSPNNQANFIEFFPNTGGSASAILGAFQFGSAGLASALSTQLPQSMLSIVSCMFVLGCIAFTTMLRTLHR